MKLDRKEIMPPLVYYNQSPYQKYLNNRLRLHYSTYAQLIFSDRSTKLKEEKSVLEDTILKGIVQTPIPYLKYGIHGRK